MDLIRHDLSRRGPFITLVCAFAIELIALSLAAVVDTGAFIVVELLLQPIVGFIVGFVTRGGWIATTAGVLGVGVVVGIGTRSGVLVGLLVMVPVGVLLFAPGYLIGQAVLPVEKAGRPSPSKADPRMMSASTPGGAGSLSTWSSSQMAFEVGPPLSRGQIARAKVIAAGVIVAVDLLIAIGIAHGLSQMGP